MLTRPRVLFALALAAALVFVAYPALSQEKKKKLQHFALIYSHGPKWAEGSALYEQPQLREHADFHRGLAKEGKLLFQGPFLDDSGSLAVIEVETRTEAMAIAASDPLVKNGVFKVELKHWLKAVERKPAK
jgi:uncharacterized protein YciI